MRFPVFVTYPLYILIAATLGAVLFAIAGGLFGFFSAGHWISGFVLAALIYFGLPRLLRAVNDDT